MNINELPEDCISIILSLTTPRDVFRSSAVSKLFLSASQSDTVWDKFLPPNCNEIISQSSSLIPHGPFASKKELFRYVSHVPILLDNNTKSFALDKRNGKICYMLGARALYIVWGNDTRYWNWEAVDGSRFPDCAVLRDVCWLDIGGEIHTRLLSPGVAYGAYFVFKLRDSSNFAVTRPMKVSVSGVTQDGLPRDGHHVTVIKQYHLTAPRRVQNPPVELPVARDDGWMEIEMGRCQVSVDNEVEGVVLDMSFKEIESNSWKYGLIVHGIELRPLCLD